MHTPRNQTLWLLTACVGAIAVVLLVTDHQSHVFGAFPYILLLACPVMHLLHRGHGGHSRSSQSRRDGQRP